ncbi:serine protease inhibitor 3/4-like [Plodia interpunctella]|uniref:serine protease inhibitor 3/4-like n=1 Tax=Plodia interpunctella TaxID=58824 RepID=UPI002367AF07|nr:serine protease inhibitor 3/4-like [Plodia interpunctella]XP_053603209.1 serine protease inhibitor 3/4-like [Plodia interpunctella]XP_053603210.1 serine protease inhibitor 3/4-like [Plodia interpunctella]
MFAAKLIKEVLLVTALILSASSKNNKPMKTIFNSRSIESKGVEDSPPPAPHNVLHMNLNGDVRRYMFNHVVTGSNKNIVCSPYIAIIPLAELLMGSSSRNYEELKNAIGCRRSKVIKTMYDLKRELEGAKDNVQLIISSTIFVSVKYTMYPLFFEHVMAISGAGYRTIHFNNTEEATEIINQWVSQQTQKEINGLVDLNKIIYPTTSLFITNALYFHGFWEHPVDSINQDIFKAPGQDIVMDMMTFKSSFLYGTSRIYGVKIIAMPYSGYKMTFVIILPLGNNNDILEDIMKTTLKNPDVWNKMWASVDKTQLRLTIPRFNVTTQLDLNKIYKKIGLKEIFDENNNILTKVVHNDRVHVTNSVHAAKIVVDEKAIKTDNQDPHVHFGYNDVKVDHPFLFFVMHNSEQILAGLFNGLPLNNADEYSGGTIQ